MSARSDRNGSVPVEPHVPETPFLGKRAEIHLSLHEANGTKAIPFLHAMVRSISRQSGMAEQIGILNGMLIVPVRSVAMDFVVTPRTGELLAVKWTLLPS